MEEEDVFRMLPGKVGAARKILSLVKEISEEVKKPKIDAKDILTRSQPSTSSQSQPIMCTSHPEVHVQHLPLKQINVDTDDNVETIIFVEKHGEDYKISKCLQSEGKQVHVEGRDSDCVSAETVGMQNDFNSDQLSSTTSIKNPVHFPIDHYLPQYSSAISLLLKNGDIHKEWDKFIEETAYHVLAVGEFETRGKYQEYGRFMFMKFPCIEHKAMKEPWGYFNKKLSRKVRNIRWKWSVRSRNPAPEKKMKKKPSNLLEINDSTQMDSKEAQKILTEEMKKDAKEQDRPLIYKALRCTFKERRQYIQNANSIEDVFRQYPFITKLIFIEKDFYQMNSNLSKDILAANWETVLRKLDVIFDETEPVERTDSDVLNCIELLSEQLQYSAKTKSSQPLIKQCKATEFSLTSKKNEAPRLVVVKEDDDSVSSCFVVGEGVRIDVGSSIKMALTNLLFCYYVWDLSYPKQYQLLGFLQHYILADRDNKFDMSSNYLKFTKKFDDVKLNESEVEDEMN